MGNTWGMMKCNLLKSWGVSWLREDGTQKKGNASRRVLETGIGNGTLLVNGQVRKSPTQGLSEFQMADKISLPQSPERP